MSWLIITRFFILYLLVTAYILAVTISKAIFERKKVDWFLFLTFPSYIFSKKGRNKLLKKMRGM